MTFSKEKIELLKEKVKERLSPKRYLHTLGVAETATILAKFCLPNLEDELLAAALLHDISKEIPYDEQMKIIRSENISVSKEDLESPAVLHSFTAEYFIKKDFSDFTTENLLSAVSKHTLGDGDMSVFDEIIFLSDFIEKNRTYDASVKVREFVFLNMKAGAISENLKILHKACIMTLDFTEKHLAKNKIKQNPKSILTRNALMSKI